MTLERYNPPKIVSMIVWIHLAKNSSETISSASQWESKHQYPDSIKSTQRFNIFNPRKTSSPPKRDWQEIKKCAISQIKDTGWFLVTIWELVYMLESKHFEIFKVSAACSIDSHWGPRQSHRPGTSGKCTARYCMNQYQDIYHTTSYCTLARSLLAVPLQRKVLVHQWRRVTRVCCCPMLFLCNPGFLWLWVVPAVPDTSIFCDWCGYKATSWHPTMKLYPTLWWYRYCQSRTARETTNLCSIWTAWRSLQCLSNFLWKCILIQQFDPLLRLLIRGGWPTFGKNHS